MFIKLKIILMKIKKIILLFLESLIRNISGGLGQRIRYIFYKQRFKRCGKNVRIDIGVIIENPENISIGNNVWLLPYSIITAREQGTACLNRIEKKVVNPFFSAEIGELIIGNEVAIGAYNIISGYGGLIIKDKVTTSARVSIYSYSHYPYDERDRSKITYANSMVDSPNIACVESPIVIEEGVWLGIGVEVFGGRIGKHSFVAAHSIVLKNLEDNSYAVGNPAIKIKERFL